MLSPDELRAAQAWLEELTEKPEVLDVMFVLFALLDENEDIMYDRDLYMLRRQFNQFICDAIKFCEKNEITFWKPHVRREVG